MIEDTIGSISSREWAVAFWFLALVTAGYKTNKKGVSKAVRNLLRILVEKKVLLIITLLTLYVGAIITVLAYYGIWEVSMLKDSLVWFFGVAFVGLLNLPKLGKKGFLRNILLQTLGITAVVEFLIGLYTFHIFIELVIVLVVALSLFVVWGSAAKGK